MATGTIRSAHARARLCKTYYLTVPKHSFTGTPAGLAGPVDLDQQARIILVATPLTALRLHQAGVRGVAVVEDPAVLAPLLPWLATKEVVIAAHKLPTLEALQHAMGEVPARSVFLTMTMPLAAQVAAVTMRPAAPPLHSSVPREPSPLLLQRLWRFAQDRVAAGVIPTGLTPATMLPLATAYGAGCFPDDVADTLSADERAALPADLGGCLVLPACDAEDRVVDLGLWHPQRGLRSLFPAPRGVVGARLLSSYPDGVRVVATVEALVEDLAAGHANTLLMRGPGDAQPLAERGLRQAEVATDQSVLRAAVQAAGIHLADAQALAVELVTVDQRLGHAIFRLGPVTLVAGLIAGGTRTHLVARRDGRLHQDDLDLAVPAQCARFAQAAARTVGIAPDCLETALSGILIRLQALGERPRALVADAPPTGSAIEDLLAAPDLVERFGADLTACGWIGDEGAKRLALLTLAGRGLDDPPWLLLRGDRALTAPALALLADLIPARHRLVVDRPTAACLARQGDLRQQMLVIDDAGSLRAETGTLLWRLQVRGAFAHPVAERDSQGRHRSHLDDVTGPVGLLATAAGATVLDDLAMVVDLDERPDLLAQHLAAARDRQGGIRSPAATAACLAPWRAVFGSLPACPILVPFAARIAFPATCPRHRRDLDALFGLIRASALLRHRRRQRSEGAIVAEEADFHLAAAAAQGVLGRQDDDLPVRAAQVLAVLAGSGRTTFTTPDILALLPAWPRTTVRHALAALVAADLVQSDAVGRGRQARTWQVVGALSAPVPQMRLLPAPPLDMATNGHTDVATLRHVG